VTILYDAAVVLGAAVSADGRASPALLRRVGHAVALFHGGRAARLLMSGGLVRRPPAEAELMRAQALAAGVPDDAVLTEARSRNTLENALFCREIIARQGWRRIALVTDGYHMPRALYCFRRVGIAVDPATAPRPPIGASLLAAHVREAFAFLVYVARMADRASLIRATKPPRQSTKSWP
jgi:uncharacterized SAM-binding protein YcdF (DUF218 family)